MRYWLHSPPNYIRVQLKTMSWLPLVFLLPSGYVLCFSGTLIPYVSWGDRIPSQAAHLILLQIFFWSIVIFLPFSLLLYFMPYCHHIIARLGLTQGMHCPQWPLFPFVLFARTDRNGEGTRKGQRERNSETPAALLHRQHSSSRARAGERRTFRFSVGDCSILEICALKIHK